MKIRPLLLILTLVFCQAAFAVPFVYPLSFQGSTAVVSDAFGPLGFMFNVDLITVGAALYTPQTPGVVASIYVFDDGSIEGWGNTTYVAAGQPNLTLAGSVGVNPCYTTAATYGGVGDPNCLVGALPLANTGWMYGQTTTFPVLPDSGTGPYAPTSYLFRSTSSISYLDGIAPPAGEMVLVLNYDQSGQAVSSLSAVPEPATGLLLGIACIAFGLRRARK